MKIFITGCCGFIGFNFANFLAKSNKKIRIIGIDNLNDYYSVNLKRKRLKELNKNKNFIFYKIDINQYEKLKELYKKYLFNYVFHFAAQAGVRYSLINPKIYIENNISGFFNVDYSLASFYGGTSLLIIVGVALDTLQQIESHLLMRHYDGFLKTGKLKGRDRRR